MRVIQQNHRSTILTVNECQKSGVFRNIVSAMTFRAMDTARTKEVREAYIERYGRHEERHEVYRDFVTQSAESLEELRKQAQGARETIIELGALSVDEEDNLQPGWFPLEAGSRILPSYSCRSSRCLALRLLTKARLSGRGCVLKLTGLPSHS